MVVLTAYATVLPDQIETALEACRSIREVSISEPGCERYDFFQNPFEGTRIVFVEEWTSKEDLDTHFQQPAFAGFMQTITPLLAAPPEIRIFESTLLD